jgi:hypothetical protein
LYVPPPSQWFHYSQAPQGIVDPNKVPAAKKESTKNREAFFLDFATAIRDQFPGLPLLVTGGFRSRKVIEGALASGSLDVVGLARPAMLDPSVPTNTLLDKSKKDDEARAIAVSIPTPWLLKKIGNYIIGAGYETVSSLTPERDKVLTFNLRPGMEGKSRPWVKNNVLKVKVLCMEEEFI